MKIGFIRTMTNTVLNGNFPADTNNLLIHNKGSKKINATKIGKMKHGDLMKELNKCKVSLIVGDKESDGNIKTFRFFEALASDCLAAISIEYDPNKEFIKDEVLREVLYVKNSDDVKKLVEMYNEDLIKRQKKELQRMFDECNININFN